MTMLKCLSCDIDLTGNQRRFCSNLCSHRYHDKKSCIIKKQQMNLQCLMCQKKLVGQQRKFCSHLCKLNIKKRKIFKCESIDCTNNVSKLGKRCCSRLCSSKNQLIRNKQFKIECMSFLGGSCQHCGFCKNYAALHFHHKDSKTKKFHITASTCMKKKREEILEEIHKCLLLCANCHAIVHHPECSIEPAGNQIMSVL